MKITIDVHYAIGEKIEMLDRVYKVIGYEHMPQRAMRYILMYGQDGTVKWEYLYKHEIEHLRKSNKSYTHTKTF